MEREQDSSSRLEIKGRDESQATAQVALAAKTAFIEQAVLETGVFHIEQLFSLAYENGDFALVDQKTKEKRV
ncbi:hypothetical protein ACEQPO_29310 [Bacillus sp. SL00103]